jgi:hypothetical protein
MDGFKVEEIVQMFVDDVRKIRPDLGGILDAHYTVLDPAVETAFCSEVYRPITSDLIKKNEDIFKGDVPRYMLRGIDFCIFWGDLSNREKDTLWDSMRSCLVASYIGGDWMKTLKDMWSSHSGREGSEIDEILKDSSTKSRIEELLQYFKETRIFKLGLEMLETFKIEQFGLEELDLSDPAKILEMIKDPENPFVKRSTAVVGQFIENKIRSGSLRKEDLVREVETLREKFKDSLGRIFKESLFGEPTRETQRAEVLLSGSPEARRARMSARLQRKVRERSGK